MMTQRQHLVTEKHLLRAVLDTNVIIAAFMSKSRSSPNLELIDRWVNDEFILLFADDLVLEYQAKLNYRQIPRKLQADFLARLYTIGERIKVSSAQIIRRVAEDPDDDVFLACAIAGNATHLVTYDPHLLTLGPTYEGVQILDGLHFLYVVRGDKLQ